MLFGQGIDCIVDGFEFFHFCFLLYFYYIYIITFIMVILHFLKMEQRAKEKAKRSSFRFAS